MTTVVVTTCSLNHLAQAKGLADSVMQYNPGYKMLIGLADRLDGRVPADYYAPHDLVEAHRLGIPEFDAMCERYTPLELNCALKSFFCDYALKHYRADVVIFLDSDILVFDSLQYLEQQLQDRSVLVSPHITMPYPDDGRRPQEREMLKNGVFNAGFFAFKNDGTGTAFLGWLMRRMVDQCYVAPKEGLNADQTWFNLVPLFFQNTIVLHHPGCNAAYWNLHERTVSKREGRYFVNERYPLLFFHFSGYSLQHPHTISRHQDRIALENQDALRELLQIYHDTLLKNKHPELLSLPHAYGKPGFGKKLKGWFKG
jgi:hypothetical protein